MKKRWLWPALSLVITFFLVNWYIGAQQSPGQKEHNISPFSIDTNQNEHETEQKLKILSNDVNLSSALNKTEALNDIVKLSEISSYKQAKVSLDTLSKEHPHFEYLRWEKGKERVQIGNKPKISSEEGTQIVSDSNQLIMKDQHYISTLVKADNLAMYQIIVSKQKDVTTTVYIKQSVIPLVEKHQKNNLRIIPYPLEKANSEYETVKANSTEPIKVLTAEDNENASHFYDREIVVKFQQSLSADELKVIETYIKGTKQLQLNNVYIFKSDTLATEELIEYFRGNWQTVYVEPHYIYITNTIENTVDDSSTQNVGTELNEGVVPNDALFSEYQWNLAQISTTTGWSYSRGSDAVTIAVLDTGVNFTHPDLEARVLKGLNVTNDSLTAEDDVGHGTHVTGIIGAQSNNNEGIAGISWYNNILPVKVLNGSGYGSTYAVAQGIIWATDQGAKVINMSLGNYASADFLHEAIQYAYNKDVVLIAATGNDNTSRPGYPAAYPEVFAVGASDSSRNRAVFSNYGDYIDVVAPGDAIPSTYIGGQYAALSGTSMATPHVAGLAGLIRSINPQLTNIQVMDIIKQTSTDLGDAGFDVYFGYGEINVERALALAASYNGTLQTYAKDLKSKVNKIAEQK